MAVTSDPGVWAVASHELRRRGLRGVKRLARPLWMARLERRNRQAHEPLLSSDGPVVSLTTYEPRWHSVHHTIESIGSGRLRPSRLVLWVAPPLLDGALPAPLQRQVARGLEIRPCDDVGPHKKYYPIVNESVDTRALVTADDDVLYWSDWLESLVAASLRQPDLIHAHRASVMSFDVRGRFLPYREWPPCRSTRPSPLHFFTGVGGVLYPPRMQEALRRAGDGFRVCCPRADDIWLNAVAWRNGFAVRQTRVFSAQLFEVPGTRAHGLAQHNREGGGNDRQLEATYSTEERAALQALAQDTRR
jgi:hypothetical protein